MPEQTAARGVSERGPVERFRGAAALVFHRLRSERGWSYREFGERAGVAHTSLYAVERGETTPTIETLAAVASACDLSLDGLLALIVDAMRHETPGGTLADLLAAAAPLSEHQRRELTRFAEFLRFRDGDQLHPRPLP